MNQNNIENLYIDLTREIEKVAIEIRNNQNQKKMKEFDNKLNILTQTSKSLSKLMNYYKFNKNI
jgi:hypothetical protein